MSIVPATKFTFFPRLPQELQMLVWAHASAGVAMNGYDSELAFEAERWIHYICPSSSRLFLNYWKAWDPRYDVVSDGVSTMALLQTCRLSRWVMLRSWKSVLSGLKTEYDPHKEDDGWDDHTNHPHTCWQATKVKKCMIMEIDGLLEGRPDGVAEKLKDRRERAGRRYYNNGLEKMFEDVVSWF